MDEYGKGQNEREKCRIIIDEEEHISISGVLDVDNFDESGFIAVIRNGAVTVKGNDFHINKLNVETGELSVDGDVENVSFNTSYGGKSGGFISRIFK